MRTAMIMAIQMFDGILQAFRDSDEAAPEISKFVGVSAVASSIRSRIELAARVTHKHILITGPTGVGKSLAAQLVHNLSERKNSGTFHALNCSALPADLVESELFGHEEGSFTGASRKHIGHFEKADRGTLFLDEIGEASQATQAKLLRVLETGEFYRLGSTTALKANTRVITATNLEMAPAIRERKFREDLYYRLYGLGIHIPPISERLEDLPHLAAAFAVEQEKKNGGKQYTFQPSAIEKLYQHSWPGNARELRAVVQNAMLLTTTDSVEADHIEFPQIHIQ